MLKELVTHFWEQGIEPSRLSYAVQDQVFGAQSYTVLSEMILKLLF